MREFKEVIGCQVKAVRRQTHQFNVLTGQKGAGLSRCVRARIGMVNNYSSSHVRFSNDDALSPNKNFSLSMNSCRDNPRRML